MTPAPNFGWVTFWPMRNPSTSRACGFLGKGDCVWREKSGWNAFCFDSRGVSHFTSCCGKWLTPLHQLLRDLLEKPRRNVVARLAVEHAGLRVREVQTVARPRDRDVGEAPLFLQPVALHDALLVRKETLLEAGQEHDVEFQAR